MVRIKVKELKGIKERTLGLIPYKKAFPVLLKTRFGIHIFGLKFPIDVLVLNKGNKVVKLSKNLKPNRFFLWNPIFNKVIELPVGEIDKNKIKLGSEIQLEFI